MCEHRFVYLRTIRVSGPGGLDIYRDLFVCERCLEYRHRDTADGLPVTIEPRD